MIKRINHIGVAVENLDEATKFFNEHFNMNLSDEERFGELRFNFSGYEGAKVELLQSTDPQGVIAKYIAKKGQGIHHITFEVDDIDAELKRLKSSGIPLINEKAYRNAHNDQVAFLHPKGTFGLLIELIQPETK